MLSALETHWSGIRFRSRAEARWAIFMDEIGVGYEYEAEGFALPGRGYLPDFRVSALGLWLEIKPDLRDESGGIRWSPDGEEVYEVARAHGERGIVLRGSPGPVDIWDGQELTYKGFAEGDSEYYWCECPGCGSIDIQWRGFADRNRHSESCSSHSTGRYYGADTPKLLSAYIRARSHRFWNPAA